MTKKEWQGKIYLDKDRAGFKAYIQIFPSTKLLKALQKADGAELEEWLNKNKDKLKFIVDSCDYYYTT